MNDYYNDYLMLDATIIFYFVDEFDNIIEMTHATYQTRQLIQLAQKLIDDLGIRKNYEVWRKEYYK